MEKKLLIFRYHHLSDHFPIIFIIKLKWDLLCNNIQSMEAELWYIYILFTFTLFLEHSAELWLQGTDRYINNILPEFTGAE